MALEIENCFLSASDDKSRLAEMLTQVMQDLNLHKMCTLTGKIYLYFDRKYFTVIHFIYVTI